MHIDQRKEQFSRAYVRAVAAVAGFTISEPEVDDDSVDLTLSVRGLRGTIRSPKLDAQLKCTHVADFSAVALRYPLKRKNYDDLIPTDVQVPRILIVVLVPSDIANWLEQDHPQMTMRNCGYWVSLRGQAPSTNDTSVTVALPIAQTFNVDQLTNMMARIGVGNLP
jgi:hypothetical protein